jgi:undecaprenyl-diphosphatase
VSEPSLLQAFVLGAVQGLGEFLPISSSGHLIVVPWLFGWPDQSLTFDVALHVGTLVAVAGAFAGDWLRLLRGGVSGLLSGRPFAERDSRQLWLIALASVPGAVVGFLLDHWAETVFRAPWLVACDMALLGAVLFVADRGARSDGPPVDGVRDALLIGLAQSLAIVPGVSRSGATITMALFLGYPRGEAARFSFLLATPITFGAAVLKLRHIHGVDASMAVGMLTAAVCGVLAIKVLLAYVRTRDYRPFVAYRFAFAALVGLVYLAR